MSPRVRLLSSGELADALGISRRSITRYVADGVLVPKFVTPGGQYRFDLEEALAQMRAVREREQRE